VKTRATATGNNASNTIVEKRTMSGLISRKYDKAEYE
jgi:hypothetical protein